MTDDKGCDRGTKAEQGPSDPGSPLVAFLERNRTVGEFNSSDSFTINLDSAWVKFGKHTSQRPYSWILRFVQCAVEAGCPELKIRDSKSETSIIFPETESLSLRALKKAYDRFSPEGICQEHLLGAVLTLQTLPGSVTFRQGALNWVPGQELVESRFTGQGESLQCLFKPEPLSFWQSLKRRIRKSVGILEELKSFCYASPIKIKIDGRRLGLESKGAHLLAATISSDLDAPLLTKQPIIENGVPFCRWRYGRVNDVSYGVRCVLQASDFMGENLMFDWVRSGVVIKREGTRVLRASDLQTNLLLPTGNLVFDLTGFDFREDGRAARRRVQGKSYLREGLLELLTQVKSGKNLAWTRAPKGGSESRKVLEGFQVVRQVSSLLRRLPEDGQ